MGLNVFDFQSATMLLIEISPSCLSCFKIFHLNSEVLQLNVSQRSETFASCYLKN